MMLQQTLTIPKTTKHLSVDLPEPIPAGTAIFRLEWVAAPITASAHEDCANNIRELRSLCKSSSVTVDGFLEKRHSSDGELKEPAALEAAPVLWFRPLKEKQ